MDVRIGSLIRRKELIVLLFCLLVGFSLRFYRFDEKSLWMDEVYTFNDSRDDFKGQLKWYKENPDFLHPPLFFVLTHQFYPFEEPERDLRVIPLIFGTLSIPMIYFLARSFCTGIALPCTLALTFMAYHISLSQDGRSYSFLMFFGMASLYFFMEYLKTLRRRHLVLVVLFFAVLFHTSYSSIPFIVLSQVLWFYVEREDHQTPSLTSFLILNGLTLASCLPWITFLLVNYHGQELMDPLETEIPISFLPTLQGVLHDWVPHLPLTVVSVMFLIIFPIFSRRRRNALVLIALFILPIGGLYLYCKLLNITHFVTSRYFINFLPIFLISLFLSTDALETRFGNLRRILRLKVLFVILFIASNLVMLPLYYRSEKQDFRGLVTFLKEHLRKGDKIFVDSLGYFPGILHYFKIYPPGRHYVGPYRKVSEKNTEYMFSFLYLNHPFAVYHSKACCAQYVAEGKRLWVIVAKPYAREISRESPLVLKGFFDGSFLNFARFPTDASMYLFLWDPSSPQEKGIEMPVD